MLAMLRRRTPTVVKVRIAEILCRPVFGRGIARLTKDSIPNRGIRVCTAGAAVTPQVKAAIFWGVYESAEIRFLRKYVRPDVDVVELGASLGVTASHAISQISTDVSYVAAEANPALHKALGENLRDHPRARIVAGAVDATLGAATTTRLEIGATTDASRRGDSGITVPRFTLSQLLAQQRIGNIS